MKNLTSLSHVVIGIVLIPMIMIMVLTVVNILLSVIFIVEFEVIQTSVIWILHGIIIGICVVAYYIDLDEVKRNQL